MLEGELAVMTALPALITTGSATPLTVSGTFCCGTVVLVSAGHPSHLYPGSWDDAVNVDVRDPQSGTATNSFTG